MMTVAALLLGETKWVGSICGPEGRCIMPLQDITSRRSRGNSTSSFRELGSQLHRHHRQFLCQFHNRYPNQYPNQLLSAVVVEEAVVEAEEEEVVVAASLRP